MKFNNLFTLLLASSALAYNLQKRDDVEEELQKNNQTVNAVNDESKSSTNPDANSATNQTPVPTDYPEGCKNVEDAMNKCINMNGNNADSFCGPFNSAECQDALKKDFSGCKDHIVSYGNILGMVRITCAKDESGNYCPLSQEQQKSLILKEKFNELSDSLLKETCKSKNCSVQAAAGLKEMKGAIEAMAAGQTIPDEGKKELEKWDGYIATLSDDKCSSASQIKVGGALLITLLALFLSHF
ncbi:hypothetical protein PIROE2DRAFT_64693 [Piromyces sp. E2]|nr:hypothetical protein PIROE2DRAFT_64693 [Piromyces sp. E2]|eukprot:OUM57983.1 hypothetical protein PIROE2DRAFT_64693 [Piromyces sp. E2]